MTEQHPLMANWRFARLPSPPTAPPKVEMMPVSLPHVWNLEAPAQTACCLYETEFSASPTSANEYFIAFGAVAGAARVFLNGTLLGEHRGGYARFVLAATAAIKSGENRLQVLADNTRYEDVNPLMGDFTNWGGIYREVTLIETGHAHFDLLHYGAPPLEILRAEQNGRLCMNARTVNASVDAEVLYTVRDAAGQEVASRRAPTSSAKTELTVENAHPWNGMADPYCYTCTAQLWQGSTLLDETSLSFGFRTVTLDAETGFALNGRPLRLNGVAKHQDFAGVGCAPSTTQIDKDFVLIQEIGANAVRLSHYQHPQYTYDGCDARGLVTWAEIPMLSMPDGNAAVLENAALQLTELILQNRHHPAVCFWGVQNEIAMMGESLEMYRGVKRLNSLAKELDATRITAAANLYSVKNNSQLNFLTDAVGYNIYFGWYYGELQDYTAFFEKFHAENPKIPLGVTEYGVDCNLAFHTDAPECKDYTEEFQCLFHERAYSAMQADSRLWGTFVWNMFDFSSAIRDEGGVKAQNSKGLVTYDRMICKDAFYYYKACWSAESFVHLTGRRYKNRCGETTTVKAYSNCPSVVLSVNGELLAQKEGHGVFLFENVPLTPETRIIATAGACTDSMELYRVDTPDKSYTYANKGQGNKVSNWFKQQQAAVELFPEGKYSISDKIGDLLDNPRTLAVLEQELPKIMSDKRSRSMGGMTLLRILDYNAASVIEETVRRVNAKLNEIAK